MSQYALDLTRYHFKRDVHDLTIYGTWLYNEDQEDTEPALVIVPRYRMNGVAPIAIALSSAFKYNDPRYLARTAGYFARKLGFDDSIVTAHRMASLIDDNLNDLLTMPVDPTQAVQVGEAVVNLGNGNRQTVGLMDYEQIKQS
jgi:hypothetical protein